jgi:hypothetical protein
MKTRLPLTLALVLTLTPAAVAAQAESSPPPALDMDLVEQLCGAAAADSSELDACVASVEAALGRLEVEPEERSLLDQAADLVDETLEELRQVDVEATFDELVASAREFELDVDLEDLQQALDEAVAEAQTAIEELELPSGVDIQAALDEAVAEALATAEEFDLQAAVDEALADAQAAIEEADVDGLVDDAVVALEEAVDEARAVVTEAQTFIQENRDGVCRGGSISVGTTVGLAVFALTGVEWLGLQAFLAVERFTNATCGDVVGE